MLKQQVGGAPSVEEKAVRRAFEQPEACSDYWHTHCIYTNLGFVKL